MMSARLDRPRLRTGLLGTATMPHSAAAPVTMQCLEVWGGNQASDNGVIMPGLDAWVYSRPYEGDDAGGDIHYVSSCATGRITRVLVADVSGHGRQVAQVASTLRTLMRRYVNYIDQTRLVEGLNVEFSALAESGSFATAVVASYWAPTDDLVVCNAGHPRPVRYDAKRGAWHALEDACAPAAAAAAGEDATGDPGTWGAGGPANIPLGIARPTRYDEARVRLSRGDLVLIYTDSVVEARNAKGRQLGEAGLLSLLRDVDPSAPERLIPSVLAAVEEYAGGPPPDDITMLLLRPNALKPRVSPLGGVRAAGRMARAFLGSLRPGGEPFPWPQVRADNILGAFIGRANRRRRSP